MRLVAIRFDAKTIYRFMFVTQPGETASLNEPFRTHHLFVPQAQRQRGGGAKSLHIRVVTVGAGDTVDTLARRMVFDTAQVQRFRLLNGLQPNDTVRAGERVKIIAD